jgi:DNA-binding MarR family transcriptional regulator
VSNIVALPPGQSLAVLLNDLARLCRKRFGQVARSRRLGLTRAQASAIIHLSRNEGINQVSLAQLMELEPITVVRLLDRLQAAGLVERRADPTDRRARTLYLTAAARPLLERIRILGDEVEAEALDGICQTERDIVIRVLISMKSNILERALDHADEVADLEPEQVLHG